MLLRCVVVPILVMLSTSPLLAETTANPGKVTVAKVEEKPEPHKIDLQHELQVSEKYEYYDINGNSASDLRRQMKQGGTKWSDGKVYAALTSWDIKYHYDIAPREGKFCISNVATDVAIVYHLPRRLPGATAADPLAGVWDNYYEHLKEHEFGHKDLAVQAAADITKSLNTLTASDSSSTLEHEAKQLIRERLERLKKAQVEYDDETHHGETQGALLP